ncbi:hypothetical protein NB548_19095 [Vibrio parahaemolyticus]|uniref:hypothetical protein n=1 Tax=Vibrio parahaemolyticus TaxID=670 RepID=UPI00193C982E|nr:hypothetical protein [Vibrio parahaemolyticus]MBM5013366.1 hypothetical protein [Vibrio parahaemolyticus]MCR9713030.1 hypothetical protein [Vibrio parahaemolyticus]
MIDFTFYMGVWYKSLAYIFVAILGSAVLSSFLFDGSIVSHLDGAAIGVFIAVAIGYFQKRKQRTTTP